MSETSSYSTLAELEDVVELFEKLAEANRTRAGYETDQSTAEHFRGAACAYDDAARYIQQTIIEINTE